MQTNFVDDVFNMFGRKPDHPDLMIPVWSEDKAKYFSAKNESHREKTEDEKVARYYSPLAVDQHIPLMEVCQHKTGPIPPGYRPSTAIRLTELVYELLGRTYVLRAAPDRQSDFEFDAYNYSRGEFSTMSFKRIGTADMQLGNILQAGMFPIQANDFQIEFSIMGQLNIPKSEICVAVEFEMKMNHAIHDDLKKVLTLGTKVVGYRIEALASELRE